MILFSGRRREFINQPRQFKDFKPELHLLEDRTHPGNILGLASLAILGQDSLMHNFYGLNEQPSQQHQISENHLSPISWSDLNTSIRDLDIVDPVQTQKSVQETGSTSVVSPGMVQVRESASQTLDYLSQFPSDSLFNTAGGTADLEQDNAFPLPGSGSDESSFVMGNYSGSFGNGKPTNWADSQRDSSLFRWLSATNMEGFETDENMQPSFFGNNSAPIANNDTFSTHWGQNLVSAAGALLINDSDPEDDPITAILVTPPLGGQLSQFGADGSFTYVPTPGFMGVDQFTYKVTDGSLESNEATVSITVSSDNVVTVSSTGQATESGTSASFTIARTGTLSHPLRVLYQFEGTAHHGLDFQSLSGEVVIPSNEASVTIDIEPIDDVFAESTETVILQLLDHDLYDLGTGNAAALNLIDDTTDTGNIVTVAVQAHAVESSSTPGSFILTRTGSTQAALTIPYIVGGTAKAGVDYVSLSGSATFGIGQSTATVSVSTINDSWNEGNETITLELQQPAISNVYVQTVAPVVMTLTDDASDTKSVITMTGMPAIQENGGSQAAFTVQRSGSVTNALYFTYSLQTRVDGLYTYTDEITGYFASGSATATINVFPPNNTTATDDYNYAKIVLASGSYDIGTLTAETEIAQDDTSIEVEIIDDSSSLWIPNRKKVRICRKGNKSEELIVHYTFSGATNYLWNPPTGKGRFPRGSGCIEVPIEPKNDPIYPTPPSSPPPVVVITVDPVPGTSMPNGSDQIDISPFWPGQQTDAPASGNTPQTEPVIVDVYATDAQATEGTSPADTAQLTFVRSGSTANALTIRYHVNSTTTLNPFANPSTDISPSLSASPANNEITFGVGQASVPLVLSAVNDALVETSEDLHFKVIPWTGYIPGSHSQDVVTIVDDDGQDFSASFQVVDGNISSGVGLLKEGNITLTESFHVAQHTTVDSETTPEAALIFNSRERDAIPIIQARVQLNPNAPRPQHFKMQVTWDGVTLDEHTIPFPQGGTNWHQVPITLAAPGGIVKNTGSYNYSVTLTAVYSNQPDVVQGWSGNAMIASKYHSHFGSGWSFGPQDRLVTLTNGDIIRQYGSGGWGLYKLQTNGSYLSPWGDYGTLQKITGSWGQPTVFKHILPSRETKTFNEAGLQTLWTSSDSLKTISFQYDATVTDQLKTVTWFDGSQLTFNYTPWDIEGHRRVQSVVVKSPAGVSQPGGTRTWSLKHNQLGNPLIPYPPTRYLYQITRPDGARREVKGKDKLGSLETVYHETIPGVVTQIQWGGAYSASTYGIDPVALAGYESVYQGQVKAEYRLPQYDIYNPQPNAYSFVLDQVGRVLSKTAPDGGTWGYSRNDHGQIITSTDPLNRATQYEYDAYGYNTKVIHPDLTTVQHFYTTVPVNAPLLESRRVLNYSIDERGLRTDYKYSNDTYGHLTKVYLPHDPNLPLAPFVTPSIDVTWSGGNIASLADPRKSKTTLTYDSAGRVISIKDHLNNVTTITFNGKDDIASITDPLNRVTQLTYDNLHRPVKVKYPTIASGTPSVDIYYDLQGSGLVDYTTTWSTVSFPLRTKYNYNSRGLHTGTSQSGEYPTFVPLPSRSYTYSYDTRGQFVSSTDPQFPGTRRYDEAGRLDRITYLDVFDQPTQIVNFSYDQANQLTDSYDELNRRTQYEYFPSGLLKKVTRHSNQTDDLVSTFSYDAAGNQTHATDGNNKSWSRRYDEMGRPYEIFDPLGNRVAFLTYDAAGNLTHLRNGENNRQEWNYDPLNRLTFQTAGPGSILEATYTTHFDAAGQLIELIDPAGTKTKLEYDALGRMTKYTEADNLPAYKRSTLIAYSGYTIGNNSGSIVKTTDPLGRITETKGDFFGRTIQTTLPDPDGLGGLPQPIEQYTYNSRNLVETVTDHLGRVTTLHYNRLGDIRNVIYPDPDGSGPLPRPRYYVNYNAAMDPVETGHYYSELSGSDYFYKTSMVYNDLGQLTKTIEAPGTALARETLYGYDNLGRMDQVTDPRGIVSSYEFDDVGRVIGVTAPDPDGAGPLLASTTTAAYNKASQIVSVTQPDPDGSGPLGSLTTSYEYDPLARLKKVTDPRNSITQYEYNWRGQITKLTDPLNNDTSWAYDPLGRLSSETNELNASRTYLWDAGDRLTSMTDRRGWVSTFEYDNLDRVVKERWHQGNAQSPVVNTINMYYNDAGLLSDINDNQASLSYIYDGLDRLVSETASYTGTSVPVLTTMYAFGNRGQRQSTTFKVGVNTDRTEEYGYDDLGRMTWQNRTGGGGALRVENDYDSADRLIQQRRFDNGAGTGTQGVTSLYGYDDRNRRTSATHRQGTSTGAILQQFGYSFNPVNWVSSESRTIGSTTTTSDYTYDAGGQSISAAHSDRPSETFTWDANGNPTGTGYLIGPNNRLLEDPTYYYGYDAEGNRTTRTPKAGGAGVNYAWDNRNRLTTVTTSSSSVTEKYDPLNRRIGAVPSSGSSTWFGYDGDHVVSTHQGTTVTDRFTLGTGIDEVLGQEKGGTQRWLLTDGRGSVTGTTSASGGNTGSKTYGTFGGTENEAGVTDTLFAYTGREWDSAAGLQYSRNRWYDPSAKRWLSEDPIGFAGGDANLSRYVSNSPGTFTDPSGLKLGTHVDGGIGGPGVPITNSGSATRGQNYRDPDEAETLAGLERAIGDLERKRAQGQLDKTQENMLLVMINEARHRLGMSKKDRLSHMPEARSVAGQFIHDVWTGPSATETIAKAIINQGWKAIVSIGTLGFVEAGDLLEVTDDNRFLGYDIAAVGARGIAEIGLGFGLLKIGGILNRAGPVGREIAHAGWGWGFNHNALEVGRGIADVRNNGLGWGNSVQVAGGLLGLGILAGNIPRCFPKDTLVSTEHGLRPICDVNAGDKVWSFDFVTGEWRLCEVEARQENPYSGQFVTVSTDHGSVTATENHPFWVVRGKELWKRSICLDLAVNEDEGGKLEGRWVMASELQEGDVVYLRELGEAVVRRTAFESVVTTVFNLTIPELHTFAVGNANVLVHNTSGTGRIASSNGVQANKAAGDSVRDRIAAREAPADIEQPFVTVGGVRRIDVLKLGDELVGIESKVGRTALDSRVRQELARDWWLVRQKQLGRVVWEFTPSEVTGKVGPTKQLLEKLQKLGFEVRINYP